MQALPPWWITSSVKPAGPDRDMGGWTAIGFTDAQQAAFGVDVAGEVKDKDVHERALAALAAATRVEWPEVIGMTGAGAVAKIKETRADLAEVVAMPDDSMMTMDYREDRVRVMVSAATGVVEMAPRIG